jgi:hypothetical protein
MKLDASAFWFCFGHVLNRTSLAGFFLPAIDVFASVRGNTQVPDMIDARSLRRTSHIGIQCASLMYQHVLGTVNASKAPSTNG